MLRDHVKTHKWSRRTFLAASSSAPFALHLSGLHASAAAAIPVGLEMYSVRDSLSKDPAGTVRAVAAMGYQGLEFYAPYFSWSEAQAKDMRKLLDQLQMGCFSTHNSSDFFSGDKLQHAQQRKSR